MYGVVIFPIECAIPSLKLVIELLPNTTFKEEHLLDLEQVDECHRDVTTMNKDHKNVIRFMISFFILEFSLNET